MYIHIGGDVSLPVDKILGIFDIEKTSVNKDVNDYLMKLQKQGKICLLYTSPTICQRASSLPMTMYISQMCRFSR